jgi:hypothetical protein
VICGNGNYNPKRKTERNEHQDECLEQYGPKNRSPKWRIRNEKGKKKQEKDGRRMY